MIRRPVIALSLFRVRRFPFSLDVEATGRHRRAYA
jgi:hypothetical protein